MKNTAFITHPDCQLHEMGALHPESPLRLTQIDNALKGAKLYDQLEHHKAPKATLEQLKRVHDPRHLRALYDTLPENGHVQLDLETKLNPHTLDSAVRAAGANILAVELVLDNIVKNAFCSVRPPGHHAESNRPVGFCFLNNLSVGVAHALQREEINRVAVIDFDVHHGNGTEEIYLHDERVMICSIFQNLLLPMKLYEEDANRIVNRPLKAHTGSKEFRQAVSNHWLPAIDRFQPDFIFISAGFDAHWMDTVSAINLTEEDYKWVTDEIRELAFKHSQERIVSSLEGGYNLPALGSSVSQHIKALL